MDLISYTKGLPLINRIFAYILFSIAFIALLASSAFCLLMAWGLVLAVFDGWTTDYLYLVVIFGILFGLAFLEKASKKRKQDKSESRQ